MQPTTPIVSDHPDGYRVEWPGYKRAFALFDVDGLNITVSDIFRDPAQPKGSAGQMLADAFRAVGVTRPLSVRMTNILDTQPTQDQLARGIAPADTVLGQVLASIAANLGTTVTGWTHGHHRGKLWIEASFGG